MAFRGFGCAAQIKEFTCFSMDLYAQNQEFTCFPCGYRQSHIFFTQNLTCETYDVIVTLQLM